MVRGVSSRALLLVIALVASQGRGRSQSGELPSFEAASVKLLPGHDGFTSFSPFGTGRFTITNTPLILLIQIAFGVPYEQISAGNWLGPERYDVVAKAEDGVELSPKELSPRLQQLLIQRFKLAVHHEKKEVQGYALVIAKGGPKLHKSAGSTAVGAIYPGGIRGPNWPMSGLAAGLASPVGRPVVDQTGITGNYDIELNYARDGDVDSLLPSLFTALQEQLGLKLEPRKVSIEIVVIDHVERVPTGN